MEIKHAFTNVTGLMWMYSYLVEKTKMNGKNVTLSTYCKHSSLFLDLAWFQTSDLLSRLNRYDVVLTDGYFPETLPGALS